nr:HAMP domain-containing sensor histidine kinase [Tomitella gaofuii]
MNRVRSWFRAVPLRWSLVAVLVGLCAVGLVASGFAVTTALRNSMTARIDAELVDAAHTWARPLAVPPSTPPPGPPSSHRPPSRYYVQVTDSSGTPTITVNDARSAPDLASVPADGEPVTVDSVAGGPRWRVVSTPAASGGRTTVALSMADIDSTVDRLVVLELAVGAVVLVLLGGAGWLVVRRSLRPLRQIERTAAAIADGELHERVPEMHPRTEVGRLASALNGMLGQIQRAFADRTRSEESARASEARMRRFVADAGHELRTPLTTIRGFAELHRMGGQADTDTVMGHIEQESARMGVLVEDLLTLAAMDAQRPLERVRVDVFEIVAGAVIAARTVAPDRRIVLELDDGAGRPETLGDASRLRQVVDNLLTNARVHTPPDAAVTVRVATAAGGDEVTVEVADSGPGLAGADHERVFERFYRADSSRTRASGGSGLGLSIVASLVAAHGGRVEVDSAPGAGARFLVRLPSQ